MQAQYVGTLVRIFNEYSDSGTLIDPTVVRVALRVPDASAPLTFTYGVDAQVQRDSVGLYRFEYEPQVPGTFVYSWFGDGTVNAQSFGFFEVLQSNIMTMRAPSYLTSADLDNRIGAARVDQLFDDDGDGVRDAVVVNAILLEAEDLAAASMLKAYGADGVVLLGRNDETFKGQVAWIAAELASERRGEFVAEDGKGRYWAQYQRAKEYLAALSKAQIKSAGESVAGPSRQAGGTVSPRLQPDTPRFIFAPDRNAPNGRGGF